MSIQIAAWSATSSRTRTRIASSCCAAVRPSGAWWAAPAWTWRRRPDTRTWKNSSRFEAKIARNFTRSSSGFRLSRASWRTRALNSIQESSRLRIGPRWSRGTRRRLRPAARGPGAGRTAVIGPRRRSGGGRRRVAATASHVPVKGGSRGYHSAVRGHSPRRMTTRGGAGRQGSGTYRRSPVAGSTHTWSGTSVVGIEEPLVGGPEARLERVRLAAARSVSVARALRVERAVARPLEHDRGDHHHARHEQEQRGEQVAARAGRRDDGDPAEQEQHPQGARRGRGQGRRPRPTPRRCRPSASSARRRLVRHEHDRRPVRDDLGHRARRARSCRTGTR